MLYWLILFFLNLSHPFHVSVCEIEFDEDSKALQISHRIFADDLEEALRRQFNRQFDILNLKQPEVLDHFLETYLKDRFSITVNGAGLEFEYLGFEVEQDALWCYLEVKKVRKIKQLLVTNKVLLEVFDDQTNIIHFRHQGKTTSRRTGGNTHSSSWIL